MALAGALAVALVGALAPGAAAAVAPGDILVADGDNSDVLVVDPATGTRTAINGAFAEPDGLAVEADGDVLVADQGGGVALIRVDPATGAQTAVSANGAPAGGPNFGDPAGVAVEADGDILVANQDCCGGHGDLIRVDPVTGARTLVSANGAPPGGPEFFVPTGVAVEANGDILVTDSNAFDGHGGVIRVDPATGARTLVSANGAPPGGPNFSGPNGVALEADGDILLTDFAGSDGRGGVIRVDPASGARNLVSANDAPPGGPDFDIPFGLALEADGDIVVTNNGDQFSDPLHLVGVMRVDPASGERTTVSANDHPFGGLGPDFADPRALAVARTTPSGPPPTPTIGDVIASVRALDLPAGIKRALLAKLTGAQRDLAADNRGGVCGKLGAFINQVRAQGAKKISPADANTLTDQATAVSQSLDCTG